MRLVWRQYENGDDYAYETSNDGFVTRREIVGDRKPWFHEIVFVEAVCADNPEALAKLHSVLAWMTEDVGKKLAGGSGAEYPGVKTAAAAVAPTN